MILRLVDQFGGSSPAGTLFRAVTEVAPLIVSLGRPEWAVDLVLVDDPAMGELNKSYRGVPEVTDVLSFSYLLAQGQGKADLPRGRGSAAHDLWLDPLGIDQAGQEDLRLIGEVIMAPDFVSTRCSERCWALEQEFPLLLVHGCLHLMGWVHDTDEARVTMQAEETRILADGGWAHPLVP